jgi:hypothetical protein
VQALQPDWERWRPSVVADGAVTPVPLPLQEAVVFKQVVPIDNQEVRVWSVCWQ